MSRQEFSKGVKLQAWDRSAGHCECGCGQKIVTSAEYDHYPVPAALGGSNELSNCRVLDKRCHRKITAEHDVPTIAKAVRVAEKRAGVRKRQGFRGWRKFNGDVKWRTT